MIDRPEEYERLPAIHPVVEAANQVVAAKADLDIHPDRVVVWPYPDLDALSGPLGCGGDVWFVASFSGGGKTTFVTSTISRWMAQGKRIYVMPLETQPKRFRTILACMALGIHPGDALSKRLRMLPDGEAKRAAIKSELDLQYRSPFVDQVMIDPCSAVDVRGLKEGLKKAKAFGADVVVVDHIDHIAGGDGTNLAAESRRVNHAALYMAQDNELLLVLTSQLNMDILRGPDRLAKYQPPQVHHLWLPGVKTQVATGIVGLFRKIREPRGDEMQDDYEKAMKSARAGVTEPGTMLDPGVMGVTAMKLRNYGHHDGKRVFLGFDRGHVSPLLERDRYTTDGHRPWQVV